MINSVEAAVEAVGGTGKAAELVGLKPPAVSNWIARGFIPSEYFFVFADELGRSGRYVDRSVFGFKSADEPAI